MSSSPRALELQRAQRQGLVVHDLSDIFEAFEEDAFYDIIHVTRPGKEILAGPWRSTSPSVHGSRGRA